MSFDVVIYSVAGSLVAGICTGMFLRYLTKFILLLAGFVSFVLAVLSSLGIVVVRWEALSTLIEKIIAVLGGYAPAVLTLGVPFAVGCILGYFIKLPLTVEKRRRIRYL